jgi:hypothetical protein
MGEPFERARRRLDPAAFEPRDHRLRRVHALRQLLLRQPGAQTRQADRDVAHARADAEHREDLHTASEERAALAAKQTALLVEMVGQNTQLTEAVKALTERIETLTLDMHKAVINAR